MERKKERRTTNVSRQALHQGFRGFPNRLTWTGSDIFSDMSLAIHISLNSLSVKTI
jgi:hypothetical protein